ncbi:MAG: MBL fold metallo-hydrolase [Pseudomonadota bacterium]
MRHHIITVAGLAAAFSTATAHQRDLSSVEITATEVRPGLYALFGAGGNIGLQFGEDAVFLIDDQFAPLTEKISAKVKELSGGDVDFVLSTHYHGDHTGGNENFGKAGALIFGHDNVRVRVIEDNEAPANAPVVTFSDTQTFHINGETVKAVHLERAHTDGDSIVHFENANVIHGGDLLFEVSMGSFPFIDLGGGGSINGAIAAVEAIIAMSDDETTIIPGHGSLMDKAGVEAYRAMLVDIRDRVKAQIDRGRSRERIIRGRPAKAYAEGREGGFISEDRFVGFVYDSLTAE